MMNNYTLQYDGKELTYEVRELIKSHHYSHSYRSQQQVHVFSLIEDGKTVGAAVFGKPMSRNLDQTSLELRRFCLIDETPKNTESYFLSRCLKWLARNTTIKQIITFADPNQGHQGTIYKATNFTFDGEEKNGNPRIIKLEDRTIHLRQAYQKKDGVYTSDAIAIQSAMLDGRAEVIKQEKKLRYLYDLRR